MNMHKAPGIIKWIVFPVLPAFLALSDLSYTRAELSAGGFFQKALLYAFLFLLLLFLSDKLYFFLKRPAPARRWHRFLTFSRKNVLMLSALLFLIDLGYLYVYRPGTCGYDTVNQILDLVTGMDPLPFSWASWQENVSALMNDHHPVATTLIFTLFYRIGTAVGHSNIGIFIYALFQAGCLSLLFGCIICYMDRLGIPKLFALLSFLFCCSPVIAFFSIAMIKDSLFSVVFVLFFLQYAEIVSKALEKKTVSRKALLFLLFLSTVIALLNKKGMYIALVSDLALLPVLPGGRTKLRVVCCALMPVFVITILMGKLLFPLFGIFPGGKQEALGFTFQQTAGILLEDPESFSEEDRALFFRLINIPPEELESTYNPALTNAVKDYYCLHTSEDDLAAYLKLWLSQVLRHPLAALRILLTVNGGYFAPVKTANVYTSAAYYEYLGAFRQPDSSLALRNTVTGIYQTLTQTPGLSVFFLDALSLFWFPCVTAFLLQRHGREGAIVCMVPLAANMVFLILGPVCWTRYGLCQIFTLPVWASLPFVFCPRPDDMPQTDRIP